MKKFTIILNIFSIIIFIINIFFNINLILNHYMNVHFCSYNIIKKVIFTEV